MVNVRDIFQRGDITGVTERQRQAEQARVNLYGTGQVRGFGGGGSIQRAADFGGGVFVDPLAAQRAQARGLEVDRPRIEQATQQTSARLDAFNRIQNAINAGQPIPRDATATLGVRSTDLIGSRWENLRGQLGVELAQSQAKISDYNAQVGALSAQIARPTAIEQQAGASLVDRGASIQLLQRAQPAPIAASFERPFGAAPVSRVETFARQGPAQRFAVESGKAVFGEPEQGRFVPAGKGGVYQRTQEAFFGPLGYGAEIGGRYAGPVGSFFGGLIGGGVGVVAGAFEAGPKTAITALQKGVIEPTAGPFAGDVYGLAGTVFVAPRAAVTTGIKGVGIAARAAPKVLGGIRAIETSKSIYAATPITNFLSGGFVAAQRAVPAAQKVVQSKLFQFPALGASSLLGPQAGEAIVRGSFGEAGRTPQVEATIQTGTQRIQQAQIERGYKIPDFTIGGLQLGGTTGGLGAGLGFGVLGESAASFGGVSRAEAKKVFLEEARATGLSGASAEKAAKIASESYFARQAGGLFGLTAIEATTELGGRYLVGKSIAGSLSGQAIGIGTKQALKKTGVVVAKTVPLFAGLGAYEGILGQATSDITARKVKGVGELPAAIAADPLRYFTAGLAGGISAPLLGGAVIAGGTFRTLKKGSKVGAVVEKVSLGTGYGLDPLEQPGDYLASLFGVSEPRFRVRTVTGVQTQEAKAGVKIQAKVPVDILEAMTGIPTTQRVSTIQRGHTSIYGGIGTPSDIFGFGTPATTRVTTPQPINDIFADFTNAETPVQNDILDTIQEQTQQNVPTIQNVFSISTGVPASKIGVPPFFPFFPSGGEGFGGRGRERKTYLNEFFAATSLLGGNLRKQGLKVARERKTPLDNFLNYGKAKKSKSKKGRK